MKFSKKIYSGLIIAMLTLSAVMTIVPLVSAEIDSAPFAVAVGDTTALTTGAVNTQVDVVGNATSGAADPFSTVTVYLDSLSGTVLGVGNADNAGNYRITVTIPPSVAGSHYLVVNDGETESAGVEFTVTPAISTDVDWALPGDSVVVTGHGFAANDDITLTLNSTTLTTPYGTVISTVPTSDANGSFETTITCPDVGFVNFDVYNLNGTDEDLNVATTELTIDYYITCTPDNGPTGITTTISGRIAPETAYTITFNGATIGTGTTAADGSYSMPYGIAPILGIGSYEIMILWELTSNRTTTFTVRESPGITLDVTSGYVGDMVTVTGWNFSSAADLMVYFDTTVVNDTSMGFGPSNGAGDIPAAAYFVVPTVSPGNYAVKVTDEYGAESNTVIFTVIATPVFMVETRETTYTQGDILSIKSMSTTNPAVNIRITDPNGLQFVLEAATAWQEINGMYQLQYDAYSAYQLPNDAPVGLWNFSCWDSGPTAILDTNLFMVEAPATLDDVVTGIEEIQDTLGDMTDMIDSIDGDLVTIKGDTATIENLINALDFPDMAELTQISGDIATLQMSVDAIDPVVGLIAGDIATVMTNLGELEGTITSIDGNVATVETDVGTLQADLGTLQADMSDVKANVDSTPAWIAVVLALVAAVAAIFAVITIRQKIAG